MRRAFGYVGDGVAMLAFWGLVAFLLITFLTACGPRPAAGQQCDRVGDVYAHGGVVLHCVQVGRADRRWHK